MLKWNDIVCYPTGSHPYGSDVIAAHGRNWSADICITLHDAWVFEPSSFAGTIPWVPWFPVDHDPLPPPVLDKMRSALSPVVFSHFAERMCKEAGLSPLYVPHGVDTESFRPRDRQEARASLDLPMDRFIVGMVAANHGYPSRKSLPQALEAFARFRARHTDALLYLHTFRGDEPWAPPGVNLPPLVDHLGITDSVLVANSYDNFVGLSDDYLARVYSACDCLLCPSMGEGFGVPILEAQACACPVIVGDWTSMSELCFAGYKIPRGSSEPFWTGLNSYQWLPHVDSIVEGLEHMYEHRNDEQLRRAAQDGALPYDADHVTERYWKPALDEIRGRLGESGRRGGRRPRALTGRDVPVHEFFIHADSGQFYEDLHTECTPWLDLCVLLQLIRRYRPSSFLEVGTHKGHVTRAVADRFPEMHIVTVDPGDKVPPQERHPSQIHEYLPQDQIGILVADHPNVRVVR
ncbi:MAG: glycosyltransferase, partial [Planctomycetota bacterium]